MNLLRAGAALCVLWAFPALAQPVPEAVKAFGPQGAARTMLVRGTTDIGPFDPLLSAFAAANPTLRIEYQQWGSNGLYEVSSDACSAGGNGDGVDMVISSAVDLQVRLVNDGCALSYSSALTERLPAAANWRNEVFGITREPAVIVYNRELVPEADAPRSRFDLIDLLRRDDGRYRGRIATYDIDQSGLGYLFAFQDSRQATTFGSLIETFARADAVATCCSAEIIDGVASGRYLIAYNVLGSYALARAEIADNLVVVAPQDYTLMLARAAVIPRSARNPADAGRFLDFMLSPAGRRLLTAQHLIVDTDGDALDIHAQGEATLRQIPLTPALLVGLDQQKRAAFLDLWRSTFRRN